MGKRLDTFADYAIKMDGKVFSGQDAIVNDAARYRTYTFYRAYQRHKNIQNGKNVKDWIELSYQSTAEFVAAGHIFGEIQTEDGSVEHEVGWGDLWNRFGWIDDEVEDEGDRETQWKSIWKGKRLRKRQDSIDKLETHLWSAADDRMEIPVGSTATATSTPRLPYSIPSLITNVNAATPVLSSFTAGTKAQISPTTYANWNNQHVEVTDFAANAEDALFDMYHLSMWETSGAPGEDYMTGTPDDGCVMYFDLKSKKILRGILNNRNDTMLRLGERDKELYYGKYRFSWAEPLGGPNIATTAQVIYGINWDFLVPIIKRGRYLQLYKKPGRGAEFTFPNQPTGNVMYERTQYNLFPRSLRRHWKISVAA